MKRIAKTLSLALLGGVILLSGHVLSVKAQVSDNNSGTVDHIIVNPNEAYLDKGSGKQFSAQAYDENGNPVASEVVWATTGGTITQDGFYTASQGGCHQVFAIDAASGITGEATIVVNCGEGDETCLEVTPSRTTIHPGDQIQFSAHEKSGEDLSYEVNCTWYSSDGDISPNGLFTADEPGSFIITAVEKDTGRMGTGHVIVEKTQLLPWWAYTMMGSEWFWAMGLLIGLVAGLVVYICRRSGIAGSKQTNQTEGQSLFSVGLLYKTLE